MKAIELIVVLTWVGWWLWIAWDVVMHTPDPPLPYESKDWLWPGKILDAERKP